jgi:protein ATS1
LVVLFLIRACREITDNQVGLVIDLDNTIMLLACGSNSSSHLALGHNEDVSTFTPTLDIPEGEIINLVSVSAHTLLLVRHENRNTLYGIGTNTVGQLGRQCALRDEDDKQVLNGWRKLDLVQEVDGGLSGDWEPVKIGATWTTSFVVYRRRTSDQGSDEGLGELVVACGSNDFNELGYTDPTMSTTALVTTASPPRIVDVGLKQGDRVDHLACGQRHVMLIISDTGGKQRVVGWGAGRRGEFDLSTLGGKEVDNGTRKGKGKAVARPTTYRPTTLDLPLNNDERIVDISLGASHSLVHTSKGRVLAWGSNQKGQITSTSSLSNITQISASWGGSYFNSSTGELLSQGSNIYSQLLHISDGRAPIQVPNGWQVEKIVAGSEHLIYLLRTDGEEGIWVGGWNEHGNLGLGDQVDRSELTRVKLPSGRIRGIWGGCASTWIWVD